MPSQILPFGLTRSWLDCLEVTCFKLRSKSCQSENRRGRGPIWKHQTKSLKRVVIAAQLRKRQFKKNTNNFWKYRDQDTCRCYFNRLYCQDPRHVQLGSSSVTISSYEHHESTSASSQPREERVFQFENDVQFDVLVFQVLLDTVKDLHKDIHQNYGVTVVLQAPD